MKKVGCVLVFLVLFTLVGCKTVPTADGGTKEVLDSVKLVEGTEAVAPFLPWPFGTIALGIAGIATAMINKEDDPS